MENEDELTGKIEVSKKESHGSVLSMLGYILTYSNLRELWVLTRGDLDFFVRTNPPLCRSIV